MYFEITEKPPKQAYRDSRLTSQTHTRWRRMQVAGLRCYNPELKRWLSRDPIGERGGLNLYVYSSNRPTLAGDYLGLWCITLPIGTTELEPLGDPVCLPWEFNRLLTLAGVFYPIPRGAFWTRTCIQAYRKIGVTFELCYECGEFEVREKDRRRIGTHFEHWTEDIEVLNGGDPNLGITPVVPEIPEEEIQT